MSRDDVEYAPAVVYWFCGAVALLMAPYVEHWIFSLLLSWFCFLCAGLLTMTEEDA